MEKAFTIFVLLFVGSLLAFMYISAHYYNPASKLFNNVYARNCAAGSKVLKFIGYALHIAAYAGFYYLHRNGIPVGTSGPVIAGGVALALGFYLFGHPFAFSETEKEEKAHQ